LREFDKRHLPPELTRHDEGFLAELSEHGHDNFEIVGFVGADSYDPAVFHGEVHEHHHYSSHRTNKMDAKADWLKVKLIL